MNWPRGRWTPSFAAVASEAFQWPSPSTPTEKLKKLKELLDVGAITQKEFDAKKAEHLEKL